MKHFLAFVVAMVVVGCETPVSVGQYDKTYATVHLSCTPDSGNIVAEIKDNGIIVCELRRDTLMTCGLGGEPPTPHLLVAHILSSNSYDTLVLQAKEYFWTLK